MKLQQDQLYQKGEEYIRIVKLERLAVDYKILRDVRVREGIHLRMTKKEFCRLIKGTTLVSPEKQKEMLLSREPVVGSELDSTPVAPPMG